MATSNLPKAAQWYAQNLGWAVLPLHHLNAARLCTCGNPACKSPAKHPLNADGLTSASRIPKIISAWWTRWPNANIGVRTGTISGLLVLDVDPRHGGDDSLAALVKEHGPLPDTVEAITGSGGRHIVFRHPGPTMGNTASILGPGLDTRADGGYIVVAPSFAHPNGQPYAWEISSRPDRVKPAPAPAWLLTLLTAARPEHAPMLPEVFPEQTRNATLTSLAGTMRRRGASEGAILAALREENATRSVPPLDDQEVRTIAASVARYDPAHSEPDGINLWDHIVGDRFKGPPPEGDKDWNEVAADLAVRALLYRIGELPIPEGDDGFAALLEARERRSWTEFNTAIATCERIANNA